MRSVIRRKATRMSQLAWFDVNEIPAAANLNNITGDFVVSRWSANTQNTPKSAGVTGSGDGICITDAYGTYGIQIVFAQAAGIYQRLKVGGTWGTWKAIT